ncbi:MAG: PEPxxWA-CTERM sorting domain-containing protein, partial [Janthinobacterium lividum]
AGVLSNISNVTTGAYAGSTLTSFSFLNNKLAQYVDGRAAYFTLSATSATQASLTTIPGLGAVLGQPLLTGTFQFLSATAFNIGSYHVNIGDVFLSGSFTGAGILAFLNGTTASVQASSSAADTTVTFNDSAFLDFHNAAHPITETDATFNMNAIAAGVGVVNTKSSLKSFISSGSTQFSSDPAPLVAIVPEPAMWALLVVGFGMVGFQNRRRHRATSVAA